MTDVWEFSSTAVRPNGVQVTVTMVVPVTAADKDVFEHLEFTNMCVAHGNNLINRAEEYKLRDAQRDGTF